MRVVWPSQVSFDVVRKNNYTAIQFVFKAMQNCGRADTDPFKRNFELRLVATCRRVSLQKQGVELESPVVVREDRMPAQWNCTRFMFMFPVGSTEVSRRLACTTSTGSWWPTRARVVRTDTHYSIIFK